MSDFRYFAADDQKSTISVKSISQRLMQGWAAPLPPTSAPQQALPPPPSSTSFLDVDSEAAQAGIRMLTEMRGEEEEEREEKRKSETEGLTKEHDQNSFLLSQSEEKLKMLRGIYIPSYINNVAVGGVWVETTGTLRENTMHDWFPSSEFTARVAFGSLDKWCQGAGVPVLPEPGGNLSNVFVCGLTCSHLQNDSPIPIGVTVGQMTPEGEFQPFGDRHEALDGQRFHAIVPPNARGGSLVLYRNSARVNLRLIARYPYLNARNAHVGIWRDKINNLWQVKMNHPILDVIFMFMHEKNWERPAFRQEDGEEATMRIKNNVKSEALDILQQLLSQSMTVVDMNRFRIQFQPLQTGRATHLRTNQVIQKREEEKVKVQAAAKAALNVGAAETKHSHDFGVSFRLEHVLVFRNHKDDKDPGVEEEAEGEDDQLDSASVFQGAIYTR